MLGSVGCGRHAGDDPVVPFLFSTQESSDYSGNGCQEQKLSMGRSHRGSFFPCGRASIGKSADCHSVVKERRATGSGPANRGYRARVEIIGPAKAQWFVSAKCSLDMKPVS